MTEKKLLLAGIFLALLLVGCASPPPAPPEEPRVEQESVQQPDTQVEEPAPAIEEEPGSQPPEDWNFPWRIADDASIPHARLYYDFFANSFEIIEYESMHGPWRLWGYDTGDGIHLAKIVLLNQIDGFEYPVLVILGFEMEDDNITVGGEAARVYLVRDGRLDSNLTREEFGKIFTINEEDRAWTIRDLDNNWINVDVSGENLFILDFADDVRDGRSMAFLLDFFRG